MNQSFKKAELSSTTETVQDMEMKALLVLCDGDSVDQCTS